MKEELEILVKAQYPLIYLVTSEEERAEEAISKIAQLKHNIDGCLSGLSPTA